jgi:integrase
MHTQSKRQKSTKGSVQFKNSKGRLQIVFSYPVKVKGGMKRKRFYISTGYEDTPINRYRIGDIVRELQRDIDYGEVDLSLRKYKPGANLPTLDEPSPNASVESNSDERYDLIELWKKYTDFNRSQVSISTIAKDFKRFRNYIGRLPSHSLNDAIAIRDHLMANLTPDTAKRCLEQINACCKWACEEGLIDQNPFELMRIRVPKGVSEEKDINPFSKEERDQIIEAFSLDQYYGYYTDYVRFLFFTGARPSEVIGLQWNQITGKYVQFKQSVVISEEGLALKKGLKTQSKRNFPITPEIMNILASVKQRGVSVTSDGFVFPSPRGKFINQRNFATRAWKTILGKCNIPYRKPYQTRHTFITHCIEAHVNTAAIARWTGTSIAMIDKHYGATNFTNLLPPDLT